MDLDVSDPSTLTSFAPDHDAKTKRAGGESAVGPDALADLSTFGGNDPAGSEDATASEAVPQILDAAQELELELDVTSPRSAPDFATGQPLAGTAKLSGPSAPGAGSLNFTELPDLPDGPGGPMGSGARPGAPAPPSIHDSNDSNNFNEISEDDPAQLSGLPPGLELDVPPLPSTAAPSDAGAGPEMDFVDADLLPTGQHEIPAFVPQTPPDPPVPPVAEMAEETGQMVAPTPEVLAGGSPCVSALEQETAGEAAGLSMDPQVSAMAGMEDLAADHLDFGGGLSADGTFVPPEGDGTAGATKTGGVPTAASPLDVDGSASTDAASGRTAVSKPTVAIEVFQEHWWRTRLMATVTVSLLVVLAGAGIVSYLTRGDLSRSSGGGGGGKSLLGLEGAPTFNGVRVVALRSILYPTATGADVLVFVGEAQNRGSTPQGAIDVVAEVRDGAGRLVATARGPLGVEVSPPSLSRLTDNESLAATYADEAQGLDNLGVAPGKVAPFTVVVLRPPPGLEDLEHLVHLERGTPLVKAPAQPEQPTNADAEQGSDEEFERKKGKKRKGKKRRGKRRRKARD